MFISDIKMGDKKIVEKIGILSCRLMELGLIPGKEIKVINKSKNGPILILCGRTRIGIGAEVAKSIIVK